METFYVGPAGDVMDKEQVKMQDPTFFHTSRTGKNWAGYQTTVAPAMPDEPRGKLYSFIFNTRLALPAKQDFEEADPENIRKLGKLMYGDPSILRNITFTDKDITILPDITDENEDGLRQGLELLYVIGDDFYDYVAHVYDLKEGGFGDFMRRQKAGVFKAKAVGDITAFGNGFPLAILFAPVEPGQVGMGKSLMDRIDRIIMSALSNLDNMTPIEFRDAVYPALESVIRKAYDRMPHVQRNLEIHPKLDDALEAYLEAIHYVLGELIGEINFEYTYDAANDDQMIFIPSDPKVRKALDEFGKMMGSRYYSAEAIKSKVASAFDARDRFTETPASLAVLRDIPSYYNIKFSVNPQEASELKTQTRYTLDWRMGMNFTFGVGLKELGIHSEEYDIDMFDVGDFYFKG